MMKLPSHTHTPTQSKLDVFQFMNQTLCKECGDNTTSHDCLFSFRFFFSSLAKVLNSFIQGVCGGVLVSFILLRAYQLQFANIHIVNFTYLLHLHIVSNTNITAQSGKEFRNWEHSNDDNLQHGFSCQTRCCYCRCYCMCVCVCVSSNSANVQACAISMDIPNYTLETHQQ